MRRRTFHACALALLGLLLVPAGCKQSDSILLIEISGPRRNDESFVPWSFLATITPGTAEPKSFNIPKERRPSLLPQSFTIALDHSLSGPVTVSIVAYGENIAQELGYGTTVQQHIVIGGQTVIPVALIEYNVPNQGDAGTGDAGVPNDGDADPDGVDATSLEVELEGKSQ